MCNEEKFEEISIRKIIEESVGAIIGPDACDIIADYIYPNPNYILNNLKK